MAGTALAATAALLLAACSGGHADVTTPTPGPGTAASVPPSPLPSLPVEGSEIGPLAPALITWAAGIDPGAAEGRALNVPSGWTVEVVANVPGARLAAWSPDGSLVVTQGAQGTVSLVTPAGVGEAASVATLASGLSSPQGVAFARSGGTDVLVIAEDSRLVAWTYDDASTRDPRVIVDALPASGHGAKAVVIDGDTVYFSLGSSSNRDPSDRSADPERGDRERGPRWL